MHKDILNVLTFLTVIGGSLLLGTLIVTGSQAEIIIGVVSIVGLGVASIQLSRLNRLSQEQFAKDDE